MNYLWGECARSRNFNRLQGDLKTDVLIIGGGIAGILTAYMLDREGVDCTLVEANKICGGVTSGTTAKITSQHGAIYQKLLQKFGQNKARLYYEANEAALEGYRKLCENINCDFSEKDAFIYSRDDLSVIENELSALDKLGINYAFKKSLPLPFRISGAIGFCGQAEFHPLKFLYAISEKLNIFENTKVTELKANTAVTTYGKISAENIVVTTHFPFINKHGLYFMKMHQSRSYVLALKGAQSLDGMYIDASGKGLSFRGCNDLLLLGGGGHRTGERSDGWKPLEEFRDVHYPNSETVARWATQDCMTLDGMPYIGRYAKSTDRLYVATGFGKWGMTSAMLAAEILRDAILGRENPYAELFSPSRSLFHSDLAVNAAKTVFNLLTPTAPRCPHLGCALKYNPAEHSWDCPCHGSRFADDGSLLDNPATDGLK